MKNNNFKNMSIGAIASVIAGAYYMYGSRDGAAKRKQISAWSLKLKGEVMEGLEKLKTVTEPAYKDLVAKVSAKYKKIEQEELKKVVDELHSTWNKMKKEVQAEIAKKEEIIKKENLKLAKKDLNNAQKAMQKPGSKKELSKKKPAAKKAEDTKTQ